MLRDAFHRCLPVIASLGLLGLAGCPSMTLPPGVRAIRAEGTWKHPASRFSFPMTFGQFNRSTIRQYDPKGEDVGVGYSHTTDELTIAMTVFVYRPMNDAKGTPMPLAAQFPLERGAIVDGHTFVAASSPWTPPTTTNHEETAGHAVAFKFTETFADTRQEVESLLFLYQYQGWVLKYRVTYPYSQKARARPLADEFVSTFRWRG